MNLFFTRKYQYKTSESIDDIIEKLNSITNTKWYDFSDNITGKVEGHNFNLTQKWSFTVIRWIEDAPAYLKGVIHKSEGGTIINTTLRPNSFFVIFIYILVFFFITELVNINSPDKGHLLKIATILLFIPIMFGLIFFYTYQLRKRFERIMGLSLNNQEDF